jgi:hypothetical protein
MIVLLAIAGVAALGLDVLATYALVRAEDLDQSQRYAQLALVWLIPIVGALVVLTVRREALRAPERRADVPESSDDNAIDMAMVARRASRLNRDEAEPD